MRGLRDRDALLAGLADGTIDAICSDHTPVEEDHKLLPFSEAEAGATGLELLLPLVLKWAREQKIAAPHALARVTSGPASILGGVGQGLGRLAVGATADFCLLDPEQPWRVGPDTLRSQGKHSPFEGYELIGKVRQTWVHGRCVYGA